MLPAGLTLIGSYTFSGAESFHDFTGIPAGFHTLELMLRVQLAADANTIVRFNGDTTAGNYLRESLNVNEAGTPDATGAFNNTLDHAFRLFTPGAFPMTAHIVIPGYSDGLEKVGFSRCAYRTSAVSAGVAFADDAAWWLSAAAISTIRVGSSSGNFTATSVARLYGRR
jgi:hypothetical protein